ncbi:P-type DNA transfer ATPase VirB11 (plasmid) [Xylella taiwanensis]|uniref:Type IV secretion system protein n=2 Tax=Xylella taiwanensis TaxID=1444770 RepID=A0ABS8TVM6_9GAMM|nr:P-type DNA transfer ATPase VirB11 [Xylella taiwanensis]MCD8459788.1 P-type DNA transfer ATPase VirB11 [Xylella taiwanensis]MCD8474177.1 P-type DNA transfer ATPase VirB11 [Xylella taiwanensis]UFN08057.1 P-type DNA transfer ATPase VirB11 [Xylella taiwanensis]UFN10350.1 P-type DNA transfer ATPase VirB11 [Xylella taiwanensis]UFN12638.1 P-type DNA transfer ATPase VirB11 [Xylella taiwanensis]
MSSTLLNEMPSHSISDFDRSLSVRELMRESGISEALKANLTDFAINKPGSYWIEDSAGWREIPNEALSLRNLKGLATAIAVFNKKKLDNDHPIESLTLPDGERCQIVLPPACEDGTVSMTIRKPSSSRFSLANYADSGRLKPMLAKLSDEIQPWEAELLQLAKKSDFVRFFELAVEHRLNIVTVGGTGSGKTTFSKCLIDLYPASRRLFTIEDTHELTTPKHPNSVHLFFSQTITAKAVLSSCMRMKPDHIFITELRGDETWDYLMALKSGHSGSVTSIHANDCRGALYKIGSYIKQSEVGQKLDFDYIMQEVMTTIDVVIFFDRTYLKELYFDPVKKLKLLREAAS